MSILAVGSIAFDSIATPSGMGGEYFGWLLHLFFSGRQLFHGGANRGRGGRRLYAGAEDVF